MKVCGLVVLVLAILLAAGACGGGSGGLVGTWTNDELGETVEFTDDGTMLVESESEGNLEFTYKTEGGKIILGMEGIDETTSVPYLVEGDVLSIADPDRGEIKYQRD
jgi:hypothetical protein